MIDTRDANDTEVKLFKTQRLMEEQFIHDVIEWGKDDEDRDYAFDDDVRITFEALLEAQRTKAPINERLELAEEVYDNWHYDAEIIRLGARSVRRAVQ